MTTDHRGVHRATLLEMRTACQRLVDASTTGPLTGARLECCRWMLQVTEPGAAVTMPRNGEFHRATAKRWAADLRRVAQKLTRSRQIVETRIAALEWALTLTDRLCPVGHPTGGGLCHACDEEDT